MLGYWDQRLRVTRAPEGAAGGGGNGGSGNDGGSGGNQDGGAGGNNAQNQQQTKAPPPWASEFGDAFDPERAWNTINNLRQEHRKATSDLKGAQTKLTEYEQANQTELEKAQARLKELETANAELAERERRAGLRAQIAEVGKAAGAHYPDDLFNLLDEANFQIESDGKIKNAAALITAMKAERPMLFQRNGTIDQARRQGASSAASGGGNDDLSSSIRSLFRR